MKVLVTGATGFVGFHTVAALQRAGHQVRLGARSPEKLKRVYDGSGLDISDVEYGEITDEASMARGVEGCDGLVHTAAVVNLDARQSDYVHHTNVTGTKNVIGGGARHGLRSMVYVSSVTALYRADLAQLDENCELGDAASGYGRSKVDSERFVQSLQAEGHRIAITYPATIVGPDDPGMSEGNQGVAVFLNTVAMTTSSGIQLIDVRDLADIHVRLLEGEHSGRYVVGGHFLSWADFVQLLREVTGRRLPALPVPGSVLRMSGRFLDLLMNYFRFETPLTGEAAMYATRFVPGSNEKIERELNIQLRPAKDTLADAIQWMKAEGHIK